MSASANKRDLVGVGATVERYSAAAFSRIPREVSLDDLWSICGPQVDMHIRRLPLWQVFCVVYFEGLAHGRAAEAARVARGIEREARESEGPSPKGEEPGSPQGNAPKDKEGE